MNEKQIARFWSRVQRGADDQCWEWAAGRSRAGYGQFKFDGRQYPAHRLAWALGNETLIPPPDVFICHHCDNPPCCNPKHLFAGSPADNTRDAIKKGRVRHDFGDMSHRAVLTEECVRRMRVAKAEGRLHVTRAARAFGVHSSTISHAVNGDTWTRTGA